MSLKFFREFGPRKRSASDGCGYLKDVATPNFVQDKKPADGLIEADIGSTDTLYGRENQPSSFNDLIAHPFNNIGDRARDWADMASMKHSGGRHWGLQDSGKRGAVIDADSLEWDSEPGYY